MLGLNISVHATPIVFGNAAIQNYSMSTLYLASVNIAKFIPEIRRGK